VWRRGFSQIKGHRVRRGGEKGKALLPAPGLEVAPVGAVGAQAGIAPARMYSRAWLVRRSHSAGSGARRAGARRQGLKGRGARFGIVEREWKLRISSSQISALALFCATAMPAISTFRVDNSTKNSTMNRDWPRLPTNNARTLSEVPWPVSAGGRAGSRGSGAFLPGPAFLV
jgi:hypothetical protein